MLLWQPAPVHRWKKVVDCVVPIVECQKVDDGADKVARHVVVAFAGFRRRAPVVLQEVHRDNAPLRKQARRKHEHERSAHVEAQQREAQNQQRRDLRGIRCARGTRAHAQKPQVLAKNVAGHHGLEQ